MKSETFLLFLDITQLILGADNLTNIRIDWPAFFGDVICKIDRLDRFRKLQMRVQIPGSLEPNEHVYELLAQKFPNLTDLRLCYDKLVEERGLCLGNT